MQLSEDAVASGRASRSRSRSRSGSRERSLIPGVVAGQAAGSSFSGEHADIYKMAYDMYKQAEPAAGGTSSSRNPVDLSLYGGRCYFCL